jgi:catechol 2,3-dioxygenase-like lactoylglutathione lyase family enzyme
MPAIRSIAEIVLSVHDLAASLRFYRDTLGLPVISPPDMKAPVFLKAGDGATGIPQMIVLVPLPAGALPFSQPRPLHHLALELAPEDFDREQSHLQSLGHTVRSGKHPVIPSRTMYVNDPDGNEVEYICKA